MEPLGMLSVWTGTGNWSRWSEVKMRSVSKDSSAQLINNKYYKLYFYDSSRGMHMLDNHPL